MQTSACSCGNTLFFGSTQCVRCQRRVILCPACARITSASETEANPKSKQATDQPSTKPAPILCSNPGCGATLQRCRNATEFELCEGAVLADGTQDLCRYCALNTIVPDATDAEQLDRWRALEKAKHRVLYGIEKAGFPIDQPTENEPPQLAFAFRYQPSDAAEPVITGHANGLITINTDEADSVERERNRIKLDEPKRTLTAHFRHELGHYFWDRLVKTNRLNEFREVFGNETAPPYQQAQKAYYANGPDANWRDKVVSRYASMHPWEDFAETFRVYTEMAALLATAESFGIFAIDQSSFDTIIDSYRRYGVFANEMNREIGLTDPVPEQFSTPVLTKLRFVHSLRQTEPLSA